ncbi:hypothetical protein F5144DRAFT_381973 [Chaetomium tenue]|uniref:Uncharacterized protein n=1 Tax=Chaetomium tenue TaxID=1854479 RepID=A0ACB7NUT3_9PEZI|nr:hypothetical protein F5144DRAFT_381973 [Chaetomium globosum]
MVGGLPTGVIEPSLPPAVGLCDCSRLEAKCPDCQPPLSRADLPVDSEANGSLSDTAGILTRFVLSWASLPVFGWIGRPLVTQGLPRDHRPLPQDRQGLGLARDKSRRFSPNAHAVNDKLLSCAGRDGATLSRFTFERQQFRRLQVALEVPRVGPTAGFTPSITFDFKPFPRLYVIQDTPQRGLMRVPSEVTCCPEHGWSAVGSGPGP